MHIDVSASKEGAGRKAAEKGATLIETTISRQGAANIILATGASQFEMLAALTAAERVDWSRVTMFHLDEYIGLDEHHPASFRKYLKERFEDRVPPLKNIYYVEAEGGSPEEVCRMLGNHIKAHPIDVCFAGIGENGHLAFNDPPADFDTEEPYIVVELDEACRRQQLGEGWFASLKEVPGRAISMSIRQILKSRSIILTVPDERKAAAVRNTIEGGITNQVPASILQTHADTYIYLDEASASGLRGSARPG